MENEAEGRKIEDKPGILRHLLQSAGLTGNGFESQRYLTKWLLLSTAIGIVAGLGAIAFYLGIEWSTRFFLGQIVGYLPPSAAGEGAMGLTGMARPWLLPPVVAIGGLISGLIVFNLAPEAEGHGTDAAIDAIHNKRARIRARIPPIKLIASAITIGSGGSGGREGPAAQISAGFGSLLGQWFGLDLQSRRIAVSAGIGAGIGAIFRAPLGGAVLAAEILYIHDLEVEALIPSLIASIVGYSIYGAVFGYTPIFGDQPQLGFDHPIQLVYYAILGVLCGLVGILYSRSFYGITKVFHHLGLPKWLKPAIGGLIVGFMGLVLPGCLHMGYGWVQIAMGPSLFSLPLWVVLILPFAKILSTSLSIGSGGSGGIFGPGMVIGGMLGASFWRLTHALLPGMPADPASFVIIGMIAMFGGIAHAPLAVMLMVSEMTGNLSLLAPAMVSVAISTALAGNNTIYKSQIPSRADSSAHRVKFSFPLLSSLSVRDAMLPPEPLAHADVPLSADEMGDGLIIVGPNNKFVGFLTAEQIVKLPQDKRASSAARTLIERDGLVLDPDESLDSALERMAARSLSWSPVVEDGRVLGRISVRSIISTYKASLERSVRRATALPFDTHLFEARIAKSSLLVGRSLSEADLPPDTLVVSIIRKGTPIFPRGDTRLEAGDTVMITSDPASEIAVRSLLEKPPIIW